jgi:hypothetical protein
LDSHVHTSPRSWITNSKPVKSTGGGADYNSESAYYAL